MISPHLISVVESFSVSRTHQKSTALSITKSLWGDRPTYVIEPATNAKSKWCHMVLARGPSLSEKSKGSELIIIWWSEMGPDTDRVLSVVDWEKHAKDYGEETK